MCLTTNAASCVAKDKNGSSNSISLSWVNLQVDASIWEFNSSKHSSSLLSQIPKRRRKTILPLLSGHFNLHSLNGLLGPSGAGKTTLLNCLSGRCRPTSGVVSYSPSQTALQLTSSPSIVFIEQNAHEKSLIQELSVGQILKYAYCFKNDRLPVVLGKAFQAKLMEVLQAMSLPAEILQRNYSKCSGGEQRRVALAQELLAEEHYPDYWFIDEPTSGLDSQSALVVMQCLKRLALVHPITIVASIHVPNEQTLALFDRLVILAKKGLCIYSGSPFALESTLERKLGLRVAPHQKPIEVAIGVAFADGSPEGEVHRRALANDVLREEFSLLNYQKSPFSMISRNDTQSTQSSPSHGGQAFSLVDLGTHFSRQFSRTFIAGWQTLLYQLLFYIGSILLLASVFDRSMVLPSGCLSVISKGISNSTNEEDDDELLVSALLNSTNTSSSSSSLSFCDATPFTDKLLIVENINYLAFGRIFQAFPLVLNSIAAFGSLARVFRSEHRNKWYSLGSFYWATSLLSLLEMSLVVGVIASLTYFAGGEQAIDGALINWGRLAHYALSLWLYYLLHQTGGQLVAVLLLDHLNLAMALGYSLVPIANILDDYFFRVDDFGNPLFVAASELVATKYLTRYMLYAFYGVDRCGESGQSWLLEKHHVDPAAVPFYIGRVLINIGILRALTLAIMYARFGGVWASLQGVWRGEKVGLKEQEVPSLKLFLEDEGRCGNRSVVVQIDMNCAKGTQEELAVDENNNVVKFEKSKEGFEDDGHKVQEPNPSPVLIAWQQLTLHRSASLFSAASKRSAATSKPILQNLNGHLRLGTLTALIGMSGAGKTSLLRVLNGQLSGNSRLASRTCFRVSTHHKVRSAFIAQEVNAHLLPGLTVRQTLLYASKLKNVAVVKKSTGEQDESFHRSVAERLLAELGLTDAADTAVQRCSGGELRRLSIAVELTPLEMPNLMCADEPTTGLDSTSAAMIISTLKRVATQHGIAILASVHQPSPHLLATAFDQVYVLGGGACAYSGPPTAIAAHLARVAAIDLTESRYPIEILVRYSCLGADHPTVRRLIEAADDVGKEGQEFPETTLVCEAPHPPRIRFSLASTGLLLRRYLHHFTGHLWTQAVAFVLIYTLWTLALHLFFDPSIAEVDGCFSVEEDFSTSGSSVCQLTANETARRAAVERGLENNLKYNLFFNNGFYALVTMQTTFLFFGDLRVFLTEHRNGWYSSGAFYLAKTVTEVVPAVVLLPLYVYLCDIYSAHLRASIYWALLATFALAVFAAQGLAHVAVLLAPKSLSQVILLNMAALVGSFLLSNIPVTLNRMHYIYQLASSLSFSRFSNEASFLLEYGFARCKEGQLQAMLLWMGLGGSGIEGGGGGGDHYVDLYRSWLALLANGILYRLIAVWLLVRLANPSKTSKAK